MDGVGLSANNKQKQNQMLPNKMRGEFTRNQRKDSEVRVKRGCLNPFDRSLMFVLTAMLAIIISNSEDKMYKVIKQR